MWNSRQVYKSDQLYIFISFCDEGEDCNIELNNVLIKKGRGGLFEKVGLLKDFQYSLQAFEGGGGGAYK